MNRVRILADLYEDEAKYIQPGARVTVTVPRQDENPEAWLRRLRPGVRVRRND